MNEFRFDITGASLEASMVIATTQWNKALGWRVDPAEAPERDEQSGGMTIYQPTRLVLFWTVQGDVEPPTPLPSYLEGAALTEFVRSWLAQQPYGPEPDTDGSNSKGWRVYCDSWGQVENRHDHYSEPYAFVAIEPAWLTHGK